MAGFRPAGEPDTVLDPGRRRPDRAAPTSLDPGRSRPPGPGPALDHGLPTALEERFAVVASLSRNTAEADVYLVHERATGAERVIKLYWDAAQDRRLQDFLERRPHPHLAAVYETGTEADRDYQVMEHLGGRSLAELRAEHPQGLSTEPLTALVGQLAGALAALHAAGFVHRDVKPVNVMLRTRDPFDAALIDFGVALAWPEADVAPDLSGTVRYQPPELLVRNSPWLSPAVDWWGLGLIVRELAAGTALMEGLSDEELQLHLTTGPLSAADVEDERIRLLCRGLLAQNFEERWGADQVARWLSGETPPLPGLTAPDPGAFPAEVAQPYTYLDIEYRNRALLAAHMTQEWAHTGEMLFPRPRRRPSDELRRLHDWLGQYDDGTGGRSEDTREPADVRLLRLLRRMSPSHPPVYRGVLVARRRLPELAAEAAEGAPEALELIEELWRYELLPLLARGGAPDGMAEPGHGGGGLADLPAAWAARRRQLLAAIGRIEDADARTLLQRRETAVRRLVLALSLWAAAADEAHRAALRRRVLALERRFRLPWFTELVRDPDGMWAAWYLRRHAQWVADERDADERAAALREAWLARHEGLREWARIQGRPAALCWAVVEVCVIGVMCVLMIGASDIAGRAAPSAIVDAWVATVFALAAMLCFESLLAWALGGRFHPRYSMLGAALSALGRGARSAAARNAALAIVAGVILVGYLLTVELPAATPLAAGAGTALWAAARYLTWRPVREREAAEARERVRTLRGDAA